MYWLAISKKRKTQLFFPNLLFNDIIHIEKQLNYGMQQDYFWFNTIETHKHDFEYYEILKIKYHCNFDFSTFPFDYHTCNLTLGSSYLSVLNMTLLKPIIVFGTTNTTDDILHFKSTTVPFDMTAKSLPPFNYTFESWTYSYVGVSINFSRNSLGLLIGRFFGPTITFTSLSSLSYSIDIEKVHMTKLLQVK